MRRGTTCDHAVRGSSGHGAPSNATADDRAGERAEVRFGEDFPPPPECLLVRDEAVRLTSPLSRRRITSFTAEARRRDMPRQHMIRALPDADAERHETGSRA